MLVLGESGSPPGSDEVRRFHPEHHEQVRHRNKYHAEPRKQRRKNAEPYRICERMRSSQLPCI
jgi:hypothetical protein